MASRNSRLRVRLTVLLRLKLLCFMAVLSGPQGYDKHITMGFVQSILSISTKIQ